MLTFKDTVLLAARVVGNMLLAVMVSAVIGLGSVPELEFVQVIDVPAFYNSYQLYSDGCAGYGADEVGVTTATPRAQPNCQHAVIHDPLRRDKRQR